MRSLRAPRRWSSIGTVAGAAAVDGGCSRAQNSGLCGALEPDAGFIAALGGGRVLAFAGIGDPEKFFATLADAGIAVAATRSFPDHHRYTRAEAQALCDDADREGLGPGDDRKRSRAACR